MLRPDEFRVGDLANATGEGITLLLPRVQYEHTALIGEALGQRYGILLDGDLPGQAYAVKEDDPWEGILVHGIVLEMDEKSAFDPAGGLQIGALIREGTTLSVVASTGPQSRIGWPVKIALLRDLPACDERAASGFLKWRIVVGSGEGNGCWCRSVSRRLPPHGRKHSIPNSKVIPS
jgi:hypothetical protein